jgi:hypothetical protein
MAVAAGRRKQLLLITSYGLVRKNWHGQLTTERIGRLHDADQNARNNHERSDADQNLATKTRAIGDDATAVLCIFSGRGTHIAPQKLKVSKFCSIFLLAVRISSSSNRALRSLLLRVPREFFTGRCSLRLRFACLPAFVSRFAIEMPHQFAVVGNAMMSTCFAGPGANVTRCASARLCSLRKWP